MIKHAVSTRESIPLIYPYKRIIVKMKTCFPRKTNHPALLYLTCILSAVGGFLFGYDTGVIAGALPLVEKIDNFFPEDKSELGTNLTRMCWLIVNYMILAGSADGWEAAITSATVGAAFIFSFVGGFVTDRLVVNST